MPELKKIYGPPGTGKTTTLLDILQKELVAGTPLTKIAFVTHTVAARDEARERVYKIIPVHNNDTFRYFRTIHGICFNAVGLSKYQVMQVPDYLAFGDRIGMPFSVNFTESMDDDGLPLGYNNSGGNEILAIRQFAAAWMQDWKDFPDQWPDWCDTDTLKEVMDEYKAYKVENTKFDFVDMLQLYMEKPKALDIDVLIVDEAQDLSRLQWEVVHNFMGACKRVYIAGDDDQSIYGFIGADPTGFLHHPCDNEMVLPKTYRLRANIWQFANQIISEVKERRAKQIEVRGTGGEIEYWNSPIEYLDLEADQTTMVVARHHKQLAGISDMLSEKGIAYSHRGRTLVNTKRAKAIYAWIKLQRGDNVGMNDVVRILEVKGLTKEQLRSVRAQAREHPEWMMDRKLMAKEFKLNFDAHWVNELARAPHDVKKNDLIDIIIHQRGLDAIVTQPKIDLTTYHACKGREADHVVLFTDCYNSAFRNAETNPDEERRLAYVGVTRAREKLTIVAPETDMYMRSLL